MHSHPTKPAGQDPDELLTVFDISRELAISPKVALYVMQTGILPARKRRVGSLLRIWTLRRSEMDDFLGKSAELVGSVADFQARLENARRKREEAHRLLRAKIDWGGQDEPDDWGPAHIDWQGPKNDKP